jgi:hypothetical protein
MSGLIMIKKGWIFNDHEHFGILALDTLDAIYLLRFLAAVAKQNTHFLLSFFSICL